MWIVYIFLCVFVFSVQSILMKSYQQNVKMTGLSQTLYLLLISGEAALIFALMAGKDMFADPLAIRYGVIAALITLGSLFFSLLAMAHVNLTVLTVSQNAGALVLPTLFGFLVLGEAVTVMKVISLLLVMAAFLTSFLSHGPQTKGKGDRLAVISTVGVFLFYGSGTIMHKAYTSSGSLAANEAYLSWLNIFIVPILLTVLAVIRVRSGKPLRELARGIQFRYYLLVAAGVVLGTVGMVCSLKALSMVDVSIYSPLYASLFILFVTLISRLVFRENITRANYISAGLAVAAVILSVM